MLFLADFGEKKSGSSSSLLYPCNISDCESFARRTFTTPKIRTFTAPEFRHFPPPKKKHLPGGRLPTPIFFFFFCLIFLGFFDLQLMEDGKEEVLDEVVMEHIKQKVRDEVVMEHIK